MGLLLFFCSSMLFAAFAAASSRNLPIIPFDEGYAPLFGDSNLVIHRDGKSVHLSLDERTGFFFFVFCFFASFCFWLDNLCGVVGVVGVSEHKHSTLVYGDLELVGTFFSTSASL